MLIQRLFLLLKNVSKWGYNLFLNNKITDAEIRLYSDFWKGKNEKL